jgi:hypothetical protein
MAGNLALAATMIVVLACVHSAFTMFSPIISSKDLALAIRRQYRPGDVIVVIGKYENASALNFYTGVPLRSLREPAGSNSIPSFAARRRTARPQLPLSRRRHPGSTRNVEPSPRRFIEAPVIRQVRWRWREFGICDV